MLIDLIIAFIKIGLFAVGGGLATLPFIYQLSQDTGWISTSDISTMIAVSESTPGPIGVNIATYVGYLTAGLPGAILAPLALTAPSVIICIAIAKMLDKVKEAPLVTAIFDSLRPASASLILVAGFTLARSTYWSGHSKSLSDWLAIDWRLLLLSAALLFFLKKYKPHPILLILVSAVIGIVFQL